MQIISQSLNILNQLNNNIFIFKNYLELLNTINGSSDIFNEFFNNNPDFSSELELLNSSLESINTIIKPISDQLKKQEIYKNINISTSQPYAQYQVDSEPRFDAKENESLNTKSYHELIEEHIQNTGKTISPIKRSEPFDMQVQCSCCGAPKEYIYKNNNKNQFFCKVCKSTFSIKSTYSNEIRCLCPHCRKKLFVHHERKDYDVLVCGNNNCPYYRDKQLKFENGEAEEFKTNTGHYKLRYTYRLFNIDFNKLQNETNFLPNSTIDLKNIRHSQYVLGLVLTYYVNYGLSSRKVSNIMYDIHQIKISHQTIRNYCNAAAPILEKLLNNYKYELSPNIVGDETYIKVKGKTNYVFFFSDAVTKIITSNRIFENRTALNAIKSIYNTLNKYEKLPNNLSITTDGNPIYNVAQIFFSINNMPFNLHQVIGVSNKDDVSKEFRPYKQITERLNRTYKENYYGTNGYGNNLCANSYMILWVSFFNFLRKHSALNYATPVKNDEIAEMVDMPSKWLKLIELGYTYA